MSSPPDPHKQQQQAVWRLRTSTTHDAAATLYNEMSHAAAAHNSRSTSPELLQASPSFLLYGRNSNGGGPSTSSPTNPVLSLFVPATSAALAVPAHSRVSSASNSFPLTNANANAATTSANPLFYVRHLTFPSAKSAHGGARQLSAGSSALLSHQSVSSNSVTMPMAMEDPEGNSGTVGRSTLASVTPAAPLSQSSAAAGSGLSMNSLGHANLTHNNLSISASPLCGGAQPSAPVATTAAAASNAAPVYIQHISPAMSAAAPWLRPHRFGSNVSSTPTASAGAATNTMVIANSSISNSSNSGIGTGPPGQPGAAGRNISGTTGYPLAGVPAVAAAAAASVAGVSGADVARVGNPMSTSSLGVPDTPLAALDLHHCPGSEDEAALTCHLCQSLQCVCGRGGGTGEGGFTRLNSYYGRSASGDSGGVAQTAALAHQQQQHLLYLARSPASAVGVTEPPRLIPPFRMARVESGVYRGAYPVLRNFPYLRRLRLRTIVSLIPEPPTYDLKCFSESAHIQLHHIHAERAKGEVQLLPSELSEALQLILNADLHPLYVHCLDGRHVTGLVMMGMRKLQQWDITAAHAEYRRFTGEEQDEVPFITDYTGPLLVPPHIPSWLWGGSLYDPVSGQPKKLQPSTMRLRLSTTVTNGVASPSIAVGSFAGPGTTVAAAAAAAANRASTSADVSLGVRGGSSSSMSGKVVGKGGDVRPYAAAPWMSVPNAEIVASDGQLYVDVDRVRGATALYRNANATSYRNAPMLFSFEYAAARNSPPNGNDGDGGGSKATHAGGRPGKAGPHAASATAPLRMSGAAHVKNGPTTANSTSCLSSQSNSTNDSMASPPAAALAFLVAAAARGSSTSTRSSSPSSKWAMTAPLDVLQPHPALYHMQPPSPTSSTVPTTTATTGAAAAQQSQSQQRASPTPSNGSSNANGTASSSLFGNQLSALMWTSGLTTPPTGPTLRKTAVVASVGAAAAGAGEKGGGGGVSGVGASVDGVVGATVGSGTAAASGSRRAVGAGGNASGSNASSRAAKRSFSR